MTESEALAVMIPPGRIRKGKFMGGVIQIWVTRACDLSCFGCTQGSNLAGKPGMITKDQFADACDSLADYFGVVGMFGGNPAMHPQFEALCDIMRERIPFERRGLWCNNLRGKGAAARKTFNPAVSNLNVHLSQEAYDEFRRDWPEAMPFGAHKESRHSPPFVAMNDLVADESERWDMISDCDINRHWSAMICAVRGNLRAYFCEIAGAQAMIHEDDPKYPDLGMPVEIGWWRKPMSHFAEQVRFHCHRCGVPLRGQGNLSQAEHGREFVTLEHAEVYRPKKTDRQVMIVKSRNDLGVPLPKFTDYIGNAKQG